MLHRIGLLWVLLAAGASGSAQEKRAPEYRLKATLLANFSSKEFVAWPETAFPGPDSEFIVAVHGPDPFQRDQDELAEAFRGREPQGRKVRILRAGKPEDLQEAHLVFVVGKETGQTSPILKALAGRPVLLVGEAPGFAADGGGVTLDFEGGRPSFELNPDALRRAGLSPSARLLKAAPKLVKDGR